MSTDHPSADQRSADQRSADHHAPSETRPTLLTTALPESLHTNGLLAPLGVHPRAEELYSLIVAKGSIPLADAADRRTDIDELASAGLVRIDAGRLVSIPFRLAVERWVGEQESQIARARSAVSHFSALQRSTEGSFIELVRGREESRKAARHLQNNAKSELLCFDRPPYFNSAKGQITPEQPSAAERGVQYRAVYQRTALSDPDVLRTVRESIELGEEARTFSDVPMRMMIADRANAIIVLPCGTTGEFADDLDSLVVHPSSFLDALVQLFLSLWELSVPLGPLATPRPDDRHRHMLHMLATGLTDASIARELGVSERTVHRRIVRLQEMLGANTRFLLGVQAVKHGWI